MTAYPAFLLLYASYLCTYIYILIYDLHHIYSWPLVCLQYINLYVLTTDWIRTFLYATLSLPSSNGHVNITELVYPRKQDQVTFNITIIDGDDDETIEEFYLNVIPVENAVVLTPRITVEIGCSKIDSLFAICDN